MSTRWTMKDVQDKGLKIANAGELDSSTNSTASAGSKQVKLPKKEAEDYTNKPMYALGRMKAGKMNKTETAYAHHLEALKRNGEILWYAFEPLNLKLAAKCFYAVDFLVMLKSGELECHEIKGYWTDDALVKIKAAAEKFPFRFISVILKKGNWEIKEF